MRSKGQIHGENGRKVLSEREHDPRYTGISVAESVGWEIKMEIPVDKSTRVTLTATNRGITIFSFREFVDHST